MDGSRALDVEARWSQQVLFGQPSNLSKRELAERFTESAPKLWCIAVAILGERSSAEDALQDAALVAIKRIRQFERGTNFTAWAGQIVRNISLRKLRDRGRHREVELAESAPGIDPAPSENSHPVSFEPDALGIDDDLARALSELTETARVCLLMKIVLELPYTQIAAALGIPEGTAMSHVHRSRRTLSEALSNKDGFARPREGVRS